jgi:nifR3 family TIM-barrel protein
MVSAKGLITGHERTRRYLASDPRERPLAVQIFGHEPDVMAAAAQEVVEAGAGVVDINMGCPVKKVVKTGAGAALLRAPRAVAAIVSAVRRLCDVPLTVKIRAGWSPERVSACEIGRVIQDCGADAVTVHPRFATQAFSVRADWELITQVKRSVQIPVIGNGDVSEPGLALKMKSQTGCDGVMIGRGAIGNPWIFRQILQLEKGLPAPPASLAERKSVLLEHFEHLTAAMGEPRAALVMRGLLLWYTRGLPHSSRFRGSINRIMDLDSLVATMDVYFSRLEDEGIES